MRAALHAWAAGAIVIAPLIASAEPPPAEQPAGRVVNLTPDSERGWVPSEELDRQVREAARAYLAAEDAGRSADVYALQHAGMQAQQTQAALDVNLKAFNAEAGRVIERRLVMITWTKNPQNAPVPGIYAAVDLVSRFENIDRHCGYIVLYQPPTGGPFLVMRQEDNFMKNAIAADIARKQSPAAVDALWAQLSASCPNYAYANVEQGPLPEQQSDIGYPSVAAALAALKARRDVTVSNEDGWTVVEDRAANAFWSFPPQGNPAFPSAVKRTIVQQGKEIVVEMNVQCEASKVACDNLVRQFQALNEQMKLDMARRRAQ